MTLSLADIERIEAGTKGVTPGPWFSDKFGCYVFGPSEKGGDFPLADTQEEKPDQVVRLRGWGYFTGKGQGALGLNHADAVERQKANATHIAACDPATILALCALARAGLEHQSPPQPNMLPHDGKGMPVDGGTVVKVTLRNGLVSHAASARSWDVWWDWSRALRDPAHDIIAYAVTPSKGE